MPILECLCNTFGSEDTNCSNDEGICTCKEGYTGDKCDSCAEGYFQVNNDCISKLMFVYIYKVIILLFSLFLIKSFFFLSEGCKIDNFAFGSSDILVSGEYNLQDSWEECQISCQYVGGCNYWSYYSESVTDKSKHCELKHSDDEDADIEMEGAISGPKICPS